MFSRLGKLVADRWPWVIAGWLALVIALRLLAPDWNSITQDGDFQYLPSQSSSVRGQTLLDQAFPNQESKSQIVVVVARDSGEPQKHDLYVAYELARRLHNLVGATALARALRFDAELEKLSEVDRSGSIAAPHFEARIKETENARDQALQTARDELNRAVELTRDMFDILDDLKNEGRDPSLQLSDADLAAAFHNRRLLFERLGEDELAETERIISSRLFGDEQAPEDIIPAEASKYEISELWTWQSADFGTSMMEFRGRLAYARLLILHLPTEFLAVENVELFAAIQQETESVEEWARGFEDDGLHIGVSGSAAVGSDLLLASIESIRHTEIFTLVLVTLILACVYRSPLLIGLPLITIGIALSVSISLLSLMTQIQTIEGMQWIDFDVYKTTRIFIVVILFGAGTDYCLFLVSRYREEFSNGGESKTAIPLTLSRVGTALTASALTTIVGLGMMFFAEFGKLRNSGPAIAISLGITLLACLTLAPALLRAYGRLAFWPTRIRREDSHDSDSSPARNSAHDFETNRGAWNRLAKWVTAFPGLILAVSFAITLPLAYFGIDASRHVTYDMLQSLDQNRTSRQGAEMLRRHFPVGESGPVIVLAEHPSDAFLDENMEPGNTQIAAINDLEGKLQAIDGVQYIRSLASPLGNSPERQSGVVNTSVRSLPQVQALYVTQVPEFENRVTKFELVLDYDAFSLEATHVINEIENVLGAEKGRSSSYWNQTDFSLAGTSAAIRDLRRVTRSDTLRIEILVVISVYLVLVALLRRPVICLYMIVTVVLSFLVTIAITDAFFAWVVGPDYHGMDWKVPLFLFVILVAVGEDYNVYLASRIFEEQTQHGRVIGLRRAVARTGGIISSCGLIMAGTFISMTSGTWGRLLPFEIPWLNPLINPEGGSLQGIVQMGFALSLGVLLDTFFVRPILLPAFIALWDRVSPHRQS